MSARRAHRLQRADTAARLAVKLGRIPGTDATATDPATATAATAVL